MRFNDIKENTLYFNILDKTKGYVFITNKFDDKAIGTTIHIDLRNNDIVMWPNSEISSYLVQETPLYNTMMKASAGHYEKMIRTIFEFKITKVF